MSKSILFTFLLLFTSINIWTQNLNCNFLSVDDGLSQHDVSSILQDSEGFMWIGTYDGLNRFDGYDIENFFHDNNNVASLSSNRIKTLYEDYHKRIWIGTDGYGLNYYNLNDGKITQVDTPTNYDIINDIVEINNNELIVATNKGLLRLNAKAENGTIKVEVLQSPLTGFNIKHITNLKDGSTFYATTNGIWLEKSSKFKMIPGSLYHSFNSAIEVKDGRILVAGQDGLYTIDENALLLKYNTLNYNMLSMVEGIENDVWISTFNNGLFNFNLKTNELTKFDITQNNNQKSLLSALPFIYKDESNTLWISNKKGIFYTNLNTKGFYTLSKDVGHVITLFATSKEVYYGYQFGDFNKYSLSKKTNKVIKLPFQAKPFKVDTLNGVIHLATTKGLYKESVSVKGKFDLVSVFGNKKKDTSIIYTSFCKDNFGNNFYGTFKGLIVKNNNSTGWIHNQFKTLNELNHVRIFALHYDYKNNCLWIGTISKGIFKVNFDKNGFIISLENFNEQMFGDYRIPNNSIWCFYMGENDNFYVGTDTGLLIKKRNQNNFETVNNPHIQNKKIMGIIEDKDENLWLTNSQGIIQFNYNKKRAIVYNQNNGLLTNTFTEAISKNDLGQLFFGSIEGVNYLMSNELKNNPFESNAIFTSLLVNNEKIKVGQSYNKSILLKKRLNNTDTIELNYKQNDFAINFSSTNYSNVKVNTYRYKLEGYDKEWRTVKNTERFARYTNTPNGTYKLILQATNPNGQWSSNTKVITIKILPAPWHTWWAYLIYSLTFLSVIIGFIYFLINKQKLRNQITLNTLKNQQEKEINEMKLVFFTDVAHEFKTPLSLVIGPLKDLVKENISEKEKDFCHNIITRNTNRMMYLVNQLLDFRKINSGVNILKVSRYDICDFITDISKSFDWQSKNRNIKCNIISPKNYFCHFDKDIIEKVIYNLLSNAFKYTPQNGIIEIELKPTWKNEIEYFIIVIKDSGKGIPQNDKKKIFQRHFHGKERSSSGIGLHLTAKLIEAHKGEINVLNSSLGGTEFMISLPVSSKAFSEDEFLTKDDIPKHLPYNYIPGEPIKTIDFEKESNKEKILIVEDDFDLRKYLGNILSRKYLVYEASNGIEGLKSAINDIPDIIISDVMMPEMDGIEMCKAIKKNTTISHIPILMLTAKTAEEFHNQGLQAGAWDYIAKPFNGSLLLKKIENIIETRNNFRKHLTNGISSEAQNHYISYDQKFVQNAINVIEKNISNPDLSVEIVAKKLNLSRMQLHRKLKSLTGLNTTSFINSIRIKIVIKLFNEGCDRVQEAMDAVGINSYAHFNKLFKKEKGITPSKYIEKLKNQHISK